MKRSEKFKKNTARVLAIVLILAMILASAIYVLMLFGSGNGIASAKFAVYAAETEAERVLAEERMETLDAVIRYITEWYKDEVDYSDLVDAAYTGVFESLGDNWSEYYVTDEQAENFIQNVNGEYSGIGVTITLEATNCLISAVSVGGPAHKAGVKAGSYLTHIDGKPVSGWSLSDISNTLRGPAGSSVKITVDFGGVSSEYQLKRANIKVASVSSEMLEGNIGYIVVSSFSEDTADEFRSARLELLNKGMKGMIIDIRDNGGGYVSVAEDMADQLIDEGVISQYINQGEVLETVKATKSDERKVPVVLLVNENSASASELFAAALKDNKAATLVGTKTYGKGVAQVVQDLQVGSAFKLSVFYFVSPKGNAIHGVGVSPDVEVSLGKHTAAEVSAIRASVIPMDEGKKYSAGQYGLNVLAAQQRLAVLGYDVDANGIMDEKTVAAIKAFQLTFGGSPYGGLDFSTMRELDKAYEAELVLTTTDVQLEKAIELLK